MIRRRTRLTPGHPEPGAARRRSQRFMHHFSAAMRPHRLFSPSMACWHTGRHSGQRRGPVLIQEWQAGYDYEVFPRRRSQPGTRAARSSPTFPGCVFDRPANAPGSGLDVNADSSPGLGEREPRGPLLPSVLRLADKYEFPPPATQFQPSWAGSLTSRSRRQDPAPFRNRYRTRARLGPARREGNRAARSRPADPLLLVTSDPGRSQ